MKRQAFVQTYTPLARSVTSGTGIFPEVLLSQAVIESQDPVTGEIPGTLLSDKYNNYFGIKADNSWKGGRVTFSKVGEVVEGKKVLQPGTFRIYNSVLDSFKDYIIFLKSNPRYTEAGVFTAKTIADQANRLEAAGYASDPGYSELITSVASGIKKWMTPSNTFTILALATFFF